MSKLLKARAAQEVMSAEFVFNVTDTMVDTSAVENDFATTAKVFDVIGIPMGARVIGGDVTVETASNAATTHTVSVGDSGSATRYGTTVDAKTAARTALTLTGYNYTAKDNLRLTIATTGTKATAGKVRVRIDFVIANRASEVTAGGL
jgi:hypothetical protein